MMQTEYEFADRIGTWFGLATTDHGVYSVTTSIWLCRWRLRSLWNIDPNARRLWLTLHRRPARDRVTISLCGVGINADGVEMALPYPAFSALRFAFRDFGDPPHLYVECWYE